jgi:hypothetical protein
MTIDDERLRINDWQIQRTYIDAVNAIFDFLTIPMKQRSGMGIRIFDLTTCENSAN